MTDNMKQEYIKALEFWNNWLGQEEEIPEEFDSETAWKEIGSDGLETAVEEMGTQSNVLDYGCGSGWASVIMTKSGCEHVTAVDVSENGVKSAQKYAELFHEENHITFQTIPIDWLLTAEENQFDGVFCSNVLDVVPSYVSEDIIKGAARVCKNGAKVMIGLNPYFDQEHMKKSGLEEGEERHLFSDGILRIVNYTDDEWKQRLEKYFKVVECRHFRWDGEADTVNRRIFILEK